MKTQQDLELELEKLQNDLWAFYQSVLADGYSWYAEDRKTIEYKLTEDIYQIQRDIAKKINLDIN